MADVEFSNEEGVSYARRVSSNAPKGIVAWIARKSGVSRQIIALALIIVSIVMIIGSLMLPGFVAEQNRLVDPNATVEN